MSHIVRAFFAVAALAFAVPVAAQQSFFTDTGAGAATAVSLPIAPLADSVDANPSQGPSLFNRSFETFPASTAFAPPALAVQRTSNNVALMIVGGAGVLLGAVIGGDEGSIIMVAGGAVGLLGLYRYLR